MTMLDIGSSALRAAYTKLQTTSNNIANAATPGYSRQEVVLAPAGSNFDGGGFMGRGVDVVTVQRRYDDYLAREVHLATASSTGDSARASALGRLDRVFSDSANGVSAAYDDLNLGLADLANRPFDASARAVVSQRSKVLAQRIANADDRIGQVGADTDRELAQEAVSLNQKLSELAALNDKIASSHGSTHSPNDLLDRRDLLVTEINKQVRANVYINDDGSASLFAGSGDTLVLGANASRVAIAADPENPNALQMLLISDKKTVPMDDAKLGGGSIAGLLAFRNDDMQNARWQLGQLAGGLADAFNKQQALGLDLNGNVGAALFRTGSPTTIAAGGNTGDAQLSIGIVDGQALAPSDYEIGYDGSQFSLKRLSDGQVSTLAALPAQFDGLSVDLASGSFAAGDRFTLRTASTFGSGFKMVMGSNAQWATAAPASPKAGAANQGSVSVADFSVSTNDAATAAPVTITFTAAGSFDVSGAGTGNPVGVAYVPGQPLSFNGWTMSLTGTPVAGDSFTVSPPNDPGSDNRNAMRLVGLADAGIIGGQKFASAYASLVSNVGSRAQAADAGEQASAAWLSGAQSAMDEVSGVNLDEEAARLIEYQQAYQAAAKVIQTGQQMFDALIAATN